MLTIPGDSHGIHFLSITAMFLDHAKGFWMENLPPEFQLAFPLRPKFWQHEFIGIGWVN